jgi:hypothetical protein
MVRRLTIGMEKKHTNSGPFSTSTYKHSIYSKGWLSIVRSPVRIRLGGATVLVVKRSKLFWLANKYDV